MGCIAEKRGQGYRKAWQVIPGSSCPVFRRYFSLGRYPWSPFSRERPIMATKRALHLVVPTDRDWPVLGHEDDGTLILSDGFIADVEHVNGLRHGSLSESQLLQLLGAWYEERRRIGFPEDTVMEQVLRNTSAA